MVCAGYLGQAMLPLVLLGVQLLTEVMEIVVTKNCPLYFELKHAFMLCCVAKSLRVNSEALVKLAKKRRQQGYAQEYYNNLLRNYHEYARLTDIDEEGRPTYGVLEASQYLAYSVRLSDPPVTFETMIELDLEKATVRISIGERQRFPGDLILTFSVGPRHRYLISGVLTATLDATSVCPSMDFITHFRVPRQMPLALEEAFRTMAIAFVVHHVEYSRERERVPARPTRHFVQNNSPLIVVCYDGADLVPCMDLQDHRRPGVTQWASVPGDNDWLWESDLVNTQFDMENLRNRFDALMAREAAGEAGTGPVGV